VAIMTKLGRTQILFAVLLTTASCRGGCDRAGGDRRPLGALGLFPADARIAISIDFRRVRETAVWQRFSALASEVPEDRKLIDDFVARTGLDPFRQIHRVVAAFPEDARAGGAFGIIVEGEGFDEKRLLTYVRDQAKLKGGELRQVAQGRHTLWTSSAPGSPAGFFLDARRFALGGGGWAERMAALADGGPNAPPSAEASGTLARLVERVGARRSIWLGAVVPPATRERLMATPRYGIEASVMRLAAAVDFGPGLEADLVAELSNADDARALVAKVEAFVRDARTSPQVLLLGAGPYLDAITATAEGPNARIHVALDEPRTTELVTRLVGLARLRR
jgi:hypothetical protein